jgi:predicted heme/steroid binding protein
MRILANLNVAGTLDIDNVQNAGVDTDRFLVQDANGLVKYRTGAELASDIGSSNISTSKIEHIVKLGENALKGQAVYVSSADGINMIVMKASNNTESTSSKTMGLLKSGGVTNDQVYLVTEGLIDGLDTSTATAGDPVWLGINGNLIFGLTNKPYAPAHLVFLGIVTRVQQNNGEIFVKVQNGFELNELHNVQITSTPTNNDILSYESSTGLYKMKSIPTLLGYTPANQATTITINGVSYDLSANRSWNVGTVTGTGTTNYIAKFTGSGNIGSSQIFDNGTNVGINNNNPNYTLDINGTFLSSLTSNSLNDGQAGSRLYTTYNSASNISNRNLYNIVSIMALNLSNGALLGNQSYNVASQFSQVSVFGNNGTKSTQPVRAFLVALTGLGGYTPMSMSEFRFFDVKTPDFAGVNGHIVDNIYGLYVASLWGAAGFTFTNAYGIYQAGANDKNYFGGATTINNSVTANSFIRSGGTSSQFLKADGSVDSSSYLTSISSSNVTTALGYTPVPTTRTLTINGTSFDLSSDRSWTVTAVETDTLATVTARGANTSSNLTFTGTLSFGSSTRQMINLWGTQHGIGIQSSTTYFRSDSRFSWFRGGSHSDSQNDPGGGVVAMTLDGSSNLSIAGSIAAGGGTLTGSLTIGTTVNSIISNDGSGTYIENTGNNSSTRVIRLQAHDGSFNYTQLFINGSGGFVSVNNQMRAPIFYDSQDTNYFADPNNNSSFWGLAIRGDRNPSSGSNQLFLWDAGNTTTSSIGFKQVFGVWNEHGLTSGGYNTYFTMDTANRGWVFRRATNGGSDWTGVNVASISNTGHAQFDGSVRSPIHRFTDSTNGAYFTGGNDWGAKLQTNDGYIQIGPANTGYAHIYTDRGTFYFNKDLLVNGNTVLHSANYNSYSPTLTGGGASGTGGISITGSASSATNSTQLTTNYIGGVRSNPQDYFNNGIGLKVAMTGHWSVWSDTLWVNGYVGGDVPWMCALHFLRNSEPRFAISAQTSTSSGYGTIYEVITAYNIGSQSVNYANSAGSANSVSWGNVSGKPGNITYWDTWYGSSYLGSNGDLYMGWAGAWTSSWFNQSVQTGASPTFNTLYLNGSLQYAGQEYFSGRYKYTNYGYWSQWFDSIGGNGGGILMYADTLYATYGSVSDIRYKKEVSELKYGLNEILKLDTIKFKYDLPEKHMSRFDESFHIGFSAQQIQELMPELVMKDKNFDMLAITQTEMLAVVVNAFKDQQKIIENQRDLINQQQIEIENIKQTINK